MVLFTVVNILLGLAALIYWFINKKLQYWKNRNVPYVEPEFWYGNARGVGKVCSPNIFFKKMYFKLKSLNVGPVAGVYIYTQRQAFIMNLDLVKQILVKDFHIFTNRDFYHNEKDDPLSAHLAAVEDDTWKNLRQKITPTFTSGKLKTMFGTIADISDKLITTLEKETKQTGQLEIKTVLSRFTTDTRNMI